MSDQQQRGQLDQKPHPSYGLTREYRLVVLAAAGTLGVRAAAEQYRVSESSVYNWRRWYQ